MSGKPREIRNFMMLIKPFDNFTWIFLGFSVVLVALTTASTDFGHAVWKNVTLKDILHQSMVQTIQLIVLWLIHEDVSRYFNNNWNDSWWSSERELGPDRVSKDVKQSSDVWPFFWKLFGILILIFTTSFDILSNNLFWPNNISFDKHILNQSIWIGTPWSLVSQY